MSTIVSLIFILSQFFFSSEVGDIKICEKKIVHFLNTNNKNCMHAHLITSCGLEIYYSYRASIKEKELLFIGRNFNKSNFNFFSIHESDGCNRILIGLGCKQSVFAICNLLICY